MNDSIGTTSAKALWHYNAYLLEQAINMIQRLESEAQTCFVYGNAVGPHTRHIIEHYQALLHALNSHTTCIDYDSRKRDVSVQNDPDQALFVLEGLISQFMEWADKDDLSIDTPLSTRLKAGVDGNLELHVATTLGRELLFLGSHCVHHYALLGHHCRVAGVDLGQDFGKAPATIAFEMIHSTMGV